MLEWDSVLTNALAQAYSGAWEQSSRQRGEEGASGLADPGLTSVVAGLREQPVCLRYLLGHSQVPGMGWALQQREWAGFRMHPEQGVGSIILALGLPCLVV